MAVVVTLVTPAVPVTLTGMLASRLLRSGKMGVDPKLSTVRTWRRDLAPVALDTLERSISLARFGAFGDLRVCVDLVCFNVELRVGACALLPLLIDIRGMREDCDAETGLLP